MKYYLIVGEASGDLHASHLMRSLKEIDTHADFRFFGGDLMSAVGGTCVRHYRDMAYMGFAPVLLHLPAIFANMKMFRLPSTEHMDKAYHQKWFHLKGMLFPGSLYLLIMATLCGSVLVLLQLI